MVKDYQRGKIYKIVCNITGKIYIGSTCEPTLARRLAKHVGDFKCWKKDSKKSYTSSFKILEGNNYYIELLELCPCTIKEELFARERFYIKNNECVNKYKNLNMTKEDKKEYLNVTKEDKIEYDKDYRINILQKNPNFDKENYQKRLLKNPYIGKEQYQKYVIPNRKLTGNTVCLCGSIIPNFKYDIKRHEKSLKHLSYISKVNEINTPLED